VTKQQGEAKMVSRVTSPRVVFSAVLVLCAVAATSAHGFAFKAGALRGRQLTTQQLKIKDPTAKTVECKKESLEGVAPPPPQKTITLRAKYSECIAVASPAKVSEAEYEFSEAGWVSLLNAVTIEVPALKCHLTVEPASELRTVSYAALPSGIEIKAAVTGITYVSSGGLCGTAGSYTNGEYAGNVEVG
jgi:hypothetical protein